MMRHVARDDTRIVRHLVRELADHADEALSYEVKLAEARFDRDSGTTVGAGELEITTEDDELATLTAFERVKVGDLLAGLREDYDDACRHLPGHRIAGMLRDYIEAECGAIRLQKGAYFVPQRHDRALGALRELAVRCGALINRIPLPDNAEQRAMVGSAFTSNVGADLDSLAREQTDGAAAYRVAKLHRRMRDLRREADEYQANLGAELGDTAARLDLINAQMTSLLMATTDTGSP